MLFRMFSGVGLDSSGGSVPFFFEPTHTLREAIIVTESKIQTVSVGVKLTCEGLFEGVIWIHVARDLQQQGAR